MVRHYVEELHKAREDFKYLDIKHILKLSAGFRLFLVKLPTDKYSIFMGHALYDAVGVNFSTEVEAVDAVEKHFNITGQL